jgi:MFS family permease
VANRITASCIVATIAFWAYTQTLVPGVDLGDTGGFQAAVLWPEVSARQAYPLYYNAAKLFVEGTCGSRAAPRTGCDPARALNLFSAVCAAAAVGLLSYLAATLSGSIASGVVAGLLLAFSYTFWSQAIIAEVYALHLALLGACCLALHAYAARPTTRRLALFFGVYAASFGNHLSMILFLVPFFGFLLLTTPDRRALFRPAIVALAAAFAIAGALQYWPNFASVLSSPAPPEGWPATVAAFWFDTTKADWRESMVLGIGPDQAAERLAMWWFDARQQFGALGLALAAVGAVRTWTRSRAWGITLATAFAMTTLFALTYNVGDTHVFFLPAHFLAALWAGIAIGGLAGAPAGARARRGVGIAVIAAAILYAGWRGWSTWPAVDRHDDRRGEQLIARLTLGVADPDALLVSDMSWELENVLLYVARHRRPDLTWTRLGDVLPHFPFLVADQREIGREIVLTADAAAGVVSAYGPLFPIAPDGLVPVQRLSAETARIPTGAPYVMTLLTPPRERRLDEEDLAVAIASLTGGAPPTRTPGAFELIAGIAGERPSVYRSSNRPFRTSFAIHEEPFTVRMDAWLPSDTFRRPGFGHVLRGREHVQIIERGVNLVWIGRDGRASPPVYAASLFAPQQRYRLLGGTPAEFALSSPPEP